MLIILRVIKDGSEIERALDQYVVPGYKADSLHAPCGICVDCRIRLMEYANKMPNPRKLTIPVGFVLGQISVEDIDGQQCSCHICTLAGLKGGSLKAYISSLSDEVELESDLRRCNFCFEAIIGSQSASHSCGGKATILENLKNALTPKIGDWELARGSGSTAHLCEERGILQRVACWRGRSNGRRWWP